MSVIYDGQNFIEENDWWTKEIMQAIAEADRGEFATDDEVNDLRSTVGAIC